MNKIDTSFISDPTTGQPFIGPSLAFLQSGTSEIVAATIQSLIGDTTSASTPYILYGCVKSDLGAGNYSFSEGYMFYQGEVFQFPAIASIALPDTAVCNIITTNDAIADPLEFSDLIFRNVHNHRTIELTNDTSGSGDFNFDDAIAVKNLIHKRFEKREYITTLHNPNNGVLTPVYTFTASCDMQEFAFLFSCRCAISSLGVGGTIGWRINQNGVNRHTEAIQYPAAFGSMDVIQTVILVMPTAYPILKGDVIELAFDTASVANPYCSIYNLNIEASSNITSNW